MRGECCLYSSYDASFRSLSSPSLGRPWDMRTLTRRANDVEGVASAMVSTKGAGQVR